MVFPLGIIEIIPKGYHSFQLSPFNFQLLIFVNPICGKGFLKALCRGHSAFLSCKALRFVVHYV